MKATANLLNDDPRLPEPAWVTLTAAAYGVDPVVIERIVAGALSTSRFDVATAASLVKAIGARHGRPAAERAAGTDTRATVTAAVAKCPLRGTVRPQIRSADELLETLGATDGDAADVVERFDIVLDAEAAAEAVWVAALFTEGQFNRRIAAAASAAAAVRGSYEDRSGRDAPDIWEVALSSAHRDGTALDDVAVVLTAAAVNGSRWWRYAARNVDVLRAAVTLSRNMADAAPALAAMLFDATGDPDLAASAFGAPSAVALEDEHVELVLRFWYTSRRTHSDERRPTDTFLSAVTEDGTRDRKTSYECIVGTSPEFPVRVAVCFTHPSSSFASDLGGELVVASSGCWGHQWDVGELIALLADRPDLLAGAARRVPMAACTVASEAAGATIPRELIELAMRTDDLGRWLESGGAARDLLVDELTAAGSGLSADGWATVWSMLEKFRGTPAELVAIAEQTSAA